MVHRLAGLPEFCITVFLLPLLLQGLEIADPGEVVYSENRTSEVVGQGVVLECGSDQPDIYIWSFTKLGTDRIRAVVYNFGNGPKLQKLTQELGNLTVISNNASLIIENLLLTAEGVYTCQAVYDTADGVKLHYYHVHLSVLVPVSKPYILSSDSMPAEGTAMRLHCVSENGTRPINYAWEHESRGGLLTTLAEGNNDILTVTEVTRNHTGWYRCLASNMVNQELSDRIWLDIAYGPDELHIAMEPYSVIDGGFSVLERETVSFKCQASSNPPCLYVWLYNNTNVHTGPEYNITGVSRMHKGNYTCLALNKHLNSSSKKTITLTVQYPPDGAPSCTIVPANNYTDLALWCSWEGGYPQSSLYWTPFELREGEEGGSNITPIQPGLQTANNSEFTCLGSHVAMNATTSCSARTWLPPEEPQCSATGTQNNQYLVLSCSWEGGFPQALLWWTTRSGVNQGRSNESSNILVLRSGSTYSGETFLCHAKHPLAGEKQCMLTIDPPTGEPSCTILPANNYTDLALWCSWEGGYPEASLYWIPGDAGPQGSSITRIQPGLQTANNSVFTCQGSHVTLSTTTLCHTRTWLPVGEPQCSASGTQNNQYLVLSCSWEGGYPQALLWWTTRSGVNQGRSNESSNILVLRAGSTYSEETFLCHAKHPLTGEKQCMLTIDPPDGVPSCTVLPTNNYNDLGLWCSWEGGYPPPSLYWTPGDVGGSNITRIQPGLQTANNSVFTCQGSHIAVNVTKHCSTRTWLPSGEPQCFANVTQNYQYLMLSCSWEGGSPQALLWWTGSGTTQALSNESSNVLLLHSSYTYSGTKYVCHVKHPLTEEKQCTLKIGPPDGTPSCTILPVNNYTNLALWCSWEGGYPEASLYWIPGDVGEGGSSITQIHPGLQTRNNSVFHCQGNHVALNVSTRCSARTWLPFGEPKCFASGTQDNKYLMLSCSWEGGSPHALLWWTTSSGAPQGSSNESSNILLLHSSATYSRKTFVCLSKHPLAEKKQCSLRIDPPDGAPSCTILPANNYTDLALWCSWEGGYPPASLHWIPFVQGEGDEGGSNITRIQTGLQTANNSVFTCQGSHVTLNVFTTRCSTRTWLPHGEVQCSADAMGNNLMLSCSWHGGFPQALLWWTTNSGSTQGSSNESSNILLLHPKSTDRGKSFVCHAKHPLLREKQCVLKIDPPDGAPSCTILQANDYTDLALWCHWEGGYPPASLYWIPFGLGEGEDGGANITRVLRGLQTANNSEFTCQGSHIAMNATTRCSTRTWLPLGEPQCSAYGTQNNQYLVLSCSWEGGFPRALLWWTTNSGATKGSSNESSNILLLQNSYTYSRKTFVCHAKHPLAKKKECTLRIAPPGKSLSCTILPANNYTNLALWCSWEGGYPEASLYWIPGDAEPQGSSITRIQPGLQTANNSVFTCQGSHVAQSITTRCSTKTWLPFGEPQCAAYATWNNEYLMLSCSWEGGFPRALLWWSTNSGATKGSSEENSNILVLRSSYTYSGKAFVCHAKHPLTGEKRCILRLEAPILEAQRNLVSVYEGSDVQLTCSLRANYPVTEITWLNNLREHVDGAPQKYTLQRTAAWSNLTVRDADSTMDSGQYWCAAINAVGGAQLPITLVVIRYPMPPNVTISKIVYSSHQRTDVDLEWLTRSEDDLTGFFIEHKQLPYPLGKRDGAPVWQKAGADLASDVRRYKISSLDPAGSYAFRITAVNHRTVGHPSEVKSPVDPKFKTNSAVIGAAIGGMITAAVATVLLFLYMVRNRNNHPRLHDFIFGMPHSQSTENINFPEEEVIGDTEGSREDISSSIPSDRIQGAHT